jgi:hypothetical protein
MPEEHDAGHDPDDEQDPSSDRDSTGGDDDPAGADDGSTGGGEPAGVDDSSTGDDGEPAGGDDDPAGADDDPAGADDSSTGDDGEPAGVDDSSTGDDGEPAGVDDGSTGDDGEPTDPFDRRVAPYSGESTVDVDPVQPPDREDGESIEPDLPEEAVQEAERLTRLARRVPDDAEAESYRERRADLLAEHDYAARVRDDTDPAASDAEEPTLVCHPIEWLDDAGSIDPARIDEVDRAAEVNLGGAGDPEAWDAVAARNDEVVERVREAHGEVHGANAAAFATYVSNHHAKPIPAVTADELAWFREEYYPRNVWPSEEQRATLDRSLELVYREMDVPMPKQPAEEE